MPQPVGELDSAQVEHMLRRRRIARLVCEGDGLDYVGTVRYYALDLPYVYLHAPEPALLGLFHATRSVRFEVDEVESPGRWESVVGWGRIEELDRAAAPEHPGGEAGAVYRLHLDRLRGFYRGAPRVARRAP